MKYTYILPISLLLVLSCLAGNVLGQDTTLEKKFQETLGPIEHKYD